MADRNTFPVQCQDDPYPSYAVVVSGEMSYPLQGCTSEMTGYLTYLFRAYGMNAENRNAASPSRPVNYFEVTLSVPVPPADQAGIHIIPRFINDNALGYRYAQGGNRPQHLERDGPHEEEEKNLSLKGKKKKTRKRQKKSSHYVSQ